MRFNNRILLQNQKTTIQIPVIVRIGGGVSKCYFCLLYLFLWFKNYVRHIGKYIFWCFDCSNYFVYHFHVYFRFMWCLNVILIKLTGLWGNTYIMMEAEEFDRSICISEIDIAHRIENNINSKIDINLQLSGQS